MMTKHVPMIIYASQVIRMHTTREHSPLAPIPITECQHPLLPQRLRQYLEHAQVRVFRRNGRNDSASPKFSSENNSLLSSCPVSFSKATRSSFSKGVPLYCATALCATSMEKI